MRQIFGIFTAFVLVPSMQVQAWVGGPWSNDSYQTNGDDGIYEAIGTMTDGTAMYRWAVYNENPGGITMLGGQANAAVTSNVDFGGLAGAASPHIIWYRGLVYYGRCFGIVNSNMKSVMVTGNASNQGLNGSDGQLNGVDLGTGSSIEFDLDGASVVPNRKTLANSTWKGKIYQGHPLKRFHGYGTISFIGQPDMDIIIVTQASGSGAGSAFNPPAVYTFPITSSSGSSQFLPVGHRVGMKVFGTQVSTRVTHQPQVTN